MKKPSNGNNVSKKAAVLNENKRHVNPIALVIGFAIVMIAVALAYFITGTDPVSTQSTATASANATEVHYPVTLFDDGQAHHFSYHANDMTIRYFILKSTDGVIRAAFDACDVCWPAGKGYYQEGDEMICRNCGRRFASTLINEVKGGCNPAPLNRSVVNDQLVIKTEDILQGQAYFNLKGA